jgi:hypothetical protein
MTRLGYLLICSILVGTFSRANGFVRTSSPSQANLPPRNSKLSSTSTDGDYAVVGVVAPLKYLGPYPCLGLRFPHLSTTFEFLLDTGANINAVDAKFVKELSLPLVASSKDLGVLGSSGIGGSIQPGDLFNLGDCELVGLPPEQTTTFMRNLPAASIVHSTPVGDGILGLNFFLSFPAGVEFDWYGTDGDPPTLVFYYGNDLPKINNIQKGLVRVPLTGLPVGLLSLTININGVDMPALLDTGSVITVFNKEAADLAGIEIVSPADMDSENPHQKQNYGDKHLIVGGVDGIPVTLCRSLSTVSIRAGDASFGEGFVYVGDLPGLKMVAGFTGQELPAVVLGLDSLRRTYRMILRAPANELYFEQLPDKK